MSFFTFFATLFFVRSCIAGYVLEDDYTPSNFFSMFSFFTDSDPTNGFVEYVDQSVAQSSGLISTTSSTVYMGVDHTNITPNGRPSVRLTSNAAYNSGSLIILDLEHMPGGVCGTWPAFWMVGPDWPNGGEIDILEGVHTQTTNDMTLHTADGCSISNNGAFSGTINTDNCYVYAEDQSSNAGCQIDTTNTGTYGAQFNTNGGGVYATQWTTTAISMWFFQRGSIPSDITAGDPNPAGWGKPIAQFQGDCDIPEFFYNQSIVFDTTFCGDWAGNVWSEFSTCSSQASTCDAFVENNPSAFTNAYWSVNSLKVYSSSGAASSTSAVVQSTSTTVSVSIPSLAGSSSETSVYATATAVSNPNNNSNDDSDNDSNDVIGESSDGSVVVGDNNNSSDDDSQDNDDNTSSQVNNQVSSQVVNNQVSSQVNNQVSSQVNDQVSSQVVNNQVSSQVVNNQVSSQVNDQVSSYVSSQVSSTTSSVASSTTDEAEDVYVVAGGGVMEGIEKRATITAAPARRWAENPSRSAEAVDDAKSLKARMHAEKAQRVRNVGSHHKGMWLH